MLQPRQYNILENSWSATCKSSTPNIIEGKQDYPKALQHQSRHALRTLIQAHLQLLETFYCAGIQAVTAAMI